MLMGPGAGGVPTATAVVSDIVSIVSTNEVGFLQNCSCYKQLSMYPSEDVESAFFIRVSVSDKAGVLAAIASVFGEHGVSIASMIQRGQGDEAELVLDHTSDQRESVLRRRATGEEPGVLPERTHDTAGALTSRGSGTEDGLTWATDR